MKTIETCSIFTPEVEQILLENKITNWLWWEWANLDKAIKEALKVIEDEEWFNHSKWHQLYNDIYRLSYPHDILFLFWKWKLIFYFANFIFARDLYRLLRWAKIKWIWRFKSFVVALTIFIVLNKFWKTYYIK